MSSPASVAASSLRVRADTERLVSSLSGNAGYRAVLGIVVGALGGLLLLSGLLGLTHKLIADATMAGTLAAQTAQPDASDVAAGSPPASDQTATDTADGSAASATEPASKSDDPMPESTEPEPAVPVIPSRLLTRRLPRRRPASPTCRTGVTPSRAWLGR